MFRFFLMPPGALEQAHYGQKCLELYPERVSLSE